MKPASMLDTKFEFCGKIVKNGHEEALKMKLNSLTILGENTGKFKIIFEHSKGSASDFFHSTVKMALPRSRLSHLKECVLICDEFEFSVREILGNFGWKFGGCKMGEQNIRNMLIKSSPEKLNFYK